MKSKYGFNFLPWLIFTNEIDYFLCEVLAEAEERVDVIETDWYL